MGWIDLAEVYGFMLPSLYGLAWFSWVYGFMI